MSRDYNYIKDLKKDFEHLENRFRVLDSWIVSGSNENKHMELIICDAKVRGVS